MKHIANRFVVLIMVCVLSSLAVFAADKSKSVTFQNDVTVNGTTLKKGTYKVTFDEQTGELTITSKGVVVKTKGRLDRGKVSSGSAYVTKTDNSLVSITMSNDSKATIVGEGGGSSSAAQK